MSTKFFKFELHRCSYKNHFTVAIERNEEKIGSIIMPNWRFNAEHNAQKDKRFQICKILDTNGIDYEGLKAGDRVYIGRWSCVEPEYNSEIAWLAKDRILAKIVE